MSLLYASFPEGPSPLQYKSQCPYSGGWGSTLSAHFYLLVFLTYCFPSCSLNSATLASFLLLKYARSAPTSKPLEWLFPLPGGVLFVIYSIWLISFPHLNLCSNVTFSVGLSWPLYLKWSLLQPWFLVLLSSLFYSCSHHLLTTFQNTKHIPYLFCSFSVSIRI